MISERCPGTENPHWQIRFRHHRAQILILTFLANFYLVFRLHVHNMYTVHTMSVILHATDRLFQAINPKFGTHLSNLCLHQILKPLRPLNDCTGAILTLKFNRFWLKIGLGDGFRSLKVVPIDSSRKNT